jgi:peptidoglycan/LPS O-acetylase OafA/YrhL
MPEPSTPRRPVATIALVAWTFLVWTTRINNIWADDGLDTAAKTGRTALALSFTLLAAATAVALWRRREHEVPWGRPLVTGFAGWTLAVWMVRGVQIATGDHDAAFIAVHLVLAVVSIVLAGLALREESAALRDGSPSRPRASDGTAVR